MEDRKSGQLLEKIEHLSRLVGELDQGVVVSEKLSEISTSQLYYLKAIDKLDSPTLGELSRKLDYTKPSVTSGVQRLCEKGLADKIQSGEDKRVYHVSLTPQGQSLLAAYKNIYSDYARTLAAILEPAEIDTLIGLFSKIIDATDLARK